MQAERPTAPLAGYDAAGARRRFAMPIPSRDEMRAGILYILAAVFAYSLANAMIKWQVARYPLSEVVFFRSAFALVPCFALILRHRAAAPLRTWRPGQLVLIGLGQFAAMLMVYAAFGMMPLAAATAISFSGPLFVTMLSIPLLGEKVGRHRWAAVLVGFAGVVVMVQAGGGLGGGLANPGALLVLVSTAISALVSIMIRRLTLTETTAALLTYQLLTTTALSVLPLPWHWLTPTWPDVVMLIAIGLCSGVAQFWGTQASRFAPAAVMAPFGYLAMVWALALGYLAWGEVPTSKLLVGAGIVAASGVYIVYRETLRRVTAVAAAE